MYGPAHRPWLPPLLLALLVASCGPGPTPQAPDAARDHPLASLPISAGGDTIYPLPDGPEAFATIRSQLSGASRSIELEMYEFQRPDLASLILAAHDRGVTVTAIMDPSERSSQAIWSLLQQDGIQVVAFPVESRTIDHVKLLIVDRTRAIVGGINWGTRSINNRDYDVLVSGPVVANLERVFDQDLQLSGEPRPLPPATPDRQVQVLVTRPGDRIRVAALAEIGSARRSVDLEMFVLSDRLVVNALIGAVRRGVLVRALLDPGQPQNPATLVELRDAGARARLYLPRDRELLHAKLAIVDGSIVLFGSCNWSRSGFTRNHELDLLITDPTLATVFLGWFEADWSRSPN